MIMQLPSPLNIYLNLDEEARIFSKNFNVNSNLTIFCGYNGTGKTLLLRSLYEHLSKDAAYKKVSYYKTTNYNSLIIKKNIFSFIEKQLLRHFNITIPFTINGNFIVIEHKNISAGIAHIIHLLSCLYDKEVDILMVDEPELCLDYRAQLFLLHEFKKASDKLIFITTHSFCLLDFRNISDLANLIICQGVTKQLVQVNMNNSIAKSRYLKKLNKNIWYIILYNFSYKLILVEGQHDSDIFTFLFNKANPDISNKVLFYPVHGKGNFIIADKLLRLVDSKPNLIIDADAFIDTDELLAIFCQSQLMNDIVCKYGHTNAAFAFNIRNDLLQLIDKKWEEIAAIAVKHSYWLERGSKNDETQAKRRATFSTLLTLSESELYALPSSSDWIKMRKRLDFLLDILEQVGCYILRKGTIENYYNFAINSVIKCKKKRAQSELESMASTNSIDLCKYYPDIFNVFKKIISD